MEKVGIYTRVSGARQEGDRQVSELQTYAAAQGWEVVEVVAEVLSGSTTRIADRPGVARLLALAERGEISKVLVSEVSRMGRRTSDVLEILAELHSRKVGLFVLNYKLETLDATGKVNSLAQFLLTILADIARMETQTLSERIRSGLDEAVRKGKTLGRKKGTTKSSAALLKEYKPVVKLLETQSQRNTAKIAGVSYSTVQRVARAVKAGQVK